MFRQSKICIWDMVGQKTMELNLANVRIQAHQKIIIIIKMFQNKSKKRKRQQDIQDYKQT